MRTSPSRNRGKSGPVLPSLSCALCELLSRYKAVYSVVDPDYRHAFLTGTLTPVRCSCGSWFLVETDAERSSTS
jgi:hypothetical protein